MFLFCVLIAIVGFSSGQFSGLNIALNKPATQFPGYLCLKLCFPASLAVDGELDPTSEFTGHCSHTVEQDYSKAYWSVNLGGFYHVTGIRIFNRKSFGDGSVIGKRLRDFSMFGTSTDPVHEQLLYKYNYTFVDENYPVKIEIPLPNTPLVSGIKIEIPHREPPEETILTLCEVEVYSDLTCPALQLDSNTNAFYTNSTNNGSSASFTCVEGYYLPDPYQLVCQGWSWNKQPPTCQKVYCKFPLNVQNGKYSLSHSCLSSQTSLGLPYMCSIQLNCETGYKIVQGGIRYCQTTGLWSDKDQVCEIIRCTLPGVENGSYIFSNGTNINANLADYGSEVQLRCDTGFTVSSMKVRVCLQDGLWSGISAECNVVTCDHPGNDSILHGSYFDEYGNRFILGRRNFSQTIYAYCMTGYRLNTGSVMRVCHENGTWSNTDVECSIITCSSLEYVQGASYEYLDSNTSQFYSFGTVAIISCENELLLEGSSSRRCTEDGTWHGTPAKCRDSTNAAAIGGLSAAVAVLFVAVVVLVLAVLKLRSQLEHVPRFTCGFCCTIQKKEEPQNYTDLQTPGLSNGNEYDTVMETNLSV